MAGQNVVTLQGTLQSGPPRSGGQSFPTGLVNTSFGLKPSPKAAPVSIQEVRNFASANAFATIHGIGTDETVTQANFLYLRTDSPIDFRITSDDGSGGDVVAVISVDGLHIVEKPSNKFIKLLEAQGTGTIEYFASGNQ